MQCPKCRSQRSQVLSSRKQLKTVWRRRKCLRCHNGFTTFEITEAENTRRQELESIIERLQTVLVDKGETDSCSKN